MRKDDGESSSDTVARQETEIAESLGGRAHKGSGRLTGWKSDGSTDDYQIECKQTAKDSISIKSEWLEKISYEAYPNSRIPLVAIRFLNLKDPLVAQDWVMLPAEEFKKLTNLTELPS